VTLRSDREIVGRVLSGDAKAFAELVSRHEPIVVAVCRNMLDDEHGAQDAVQDTLIRAHLNLGQLKDPDRVRPWLRRIAYSVCVNRLRQIGRAKVLTPGQLDALEVVDDRHGPRQQAQAKELAEAVLRSVAELPDKYRRPIRMFYLEGASGAEIAGRLGLSAGAVRTRLCRGRDLLRPRLAGLWPAETLSRTKQARGWLPAKLETWEMRTMKLEHKKTLRRLLRGDAEVIVRPMLRGDIPAMRQFDTELTATISDINAQYPPEGQSTTPGGPWSDDQWLAEHVEKYRSHGGIILLAEDKGRIVGFADLWPTEEPEPFGASLNVECIDYFREYYLAGLETVLLREAEKIARAAGLSALDIGTNTCSGEYVSLRRFGLKVFYEYDHVLCRCRPAGAARAKENRLTPETADLTGLIKVDHWSPTDFTFRGESEPSYIAEIRRPDSRSVVEFWRHNPDGPMNLPVPENPPDKSELYVQPEAMDSPQMMTDILAECADLAGKLGAGEIQLPCPSAMELGDSGLDVIDRQFASAWLRKRLD